MNDQTQNALNPFNNDLSSQYMPATQSSDSDRAIQEVQAALVIAKRFPRNKKQAMDDILNTCMSPELAALSTYSYKRGGQEVTGISIRLAEAIAQGWQNMQYGVRELSQHNGESTVEAFAWDTERNTKVTKTFQIPHIRHSKAGAKRLTDPRDIYELIANYAARRLRNCILEVIPDDVKQAALAQCNLTLTAHADTSPDTIKKMIDKFNNELKVNKAMLEDYLGCRVEAIKPAQVIQLRKIYNSIHDGYSGAVDWFSAIPNSNQPNVADKVNDLKQKAAGTSNAG